MLTSILPPSACAACRLCCNFLPESLWESPALEDDCADRLRSMGVALIERPEGGLTLEMRFEGSQEAALCPLLDSCSGCRLSRDVRPIECRLWPLRLMLDEAGRVCVSCYNHCPGLASVPRETLLAHARSMLPLFRECAASFPASIRPLHPNYSVLFTLNESPALIRCSEQTHY